MIQMGNKIFPVRVLDWETCKSNLKAILSRQGKSIFNGICGLYSVQAGLSWGSVKVKTVRLQRQIEPGWMDIHLKFTEFCSQGEVSKL